jgi:hypothetical protein
MFGLQQLFQMKRTIFFSGLLVFLFISIVSSAQTGKKKGQEFVDGWVLLKKGDTLKGKICFFNSVTSERYDKVFFSEDTTQMAKRLGHEKLTSFGADSLVFDFIVLEGAPAPILMQRVVSGDIDMYKTWYKMPESSPKQFIYETGIFLKKDLSKDYYEVLERSFKKDMNNYFKGDTDIIQLIKDNNWTISDVDKIVRAYNLKE